MKTVKRTTLKLTFNGLTFLHYIVANQSNAHLRESASINGVVYYRVKDSIDVE
jgi:hypothetical protein